MSSLRLFWRMGWRNIWRNRRRSLITISALAFSVVLVIFFIGILEYWVDHMEEGVVRLTIGDLQIHQPLYRSDQNLYDVVREPASLIAELEAAGFTATARRYGYGLLANERSNKSAGVWVKAVSLDSEARVTTLHEEKNLIAGRYLDGGHRRFTPEDEPSDEPKPIFHDPLGDRDAAPTETVELTVGQIVLGKKLATAVDAQIGDTVAVVTAAADGSIGNELFDVVGVFKNFSELEDRTLGLMSDVDYQRLFALGSDSAHEIAVRRPPGMSLADAKATVEAIVGDAGKTESWREILPAQAEIIDLQDTLSLFFALVMYAGAGLLIMNSMLMMVFERIHEFGVMKAVGLKGRQVVGLIYFETFWLCAVAAAVGIAIGMPLTLWIGRIGIDLTAFAPEGFAFSGTVLEPVMYAHVTSGSLVVPIASLFAIAFVSVLYPATKAAILEPVEAIYHV